MLPPYVNVFATSALPIVQNVRQPPRTNVAPKMSAPHAMPTGSRTTRQRVPLDVGDRERVHEHRGGLRDAAEPAQREVGRHHLQQRADGPQQHDVELAGADVEVDHVDVADEHVGDRDPEPADAVEQRDLLEAPPGQRGEVREQREHDDEVDERQQERRRRVERERGAVLQLAADARTDELAPHREAVLQLRLLLLRRLHLHVSRPAPRRGACRVREEEAAGREQHDRPAELQRETAAE